MYNVSNDFINQVAKLGKEPDLVVETINNGTATPLLIQSFKPSFEGNLFKSVMQKAEIEVKDGQIINNNIKAKYGLKIGNDYEYIVYNTFNPYSTEINYDTSIAKTIAYDNMVKFMLEYNLGDLQLTYPCTILQLVKAICNYCGVQLYSENFYNKDLSIETDLFTSLNCTYRDILDYVCQATCTTAIIKDDKLYFKVPEETNVIITPNLLKKLKIKEHFGGCNSLVLGRGDLNDNIYSKDDTLIARDGLQEIRFDNNEIIDKRREQVIDGMFNQIKGLEYYSYNVEDLGLGIFEPCDYAEFQDLDGVNYKVLVLNQSLEITSGASGKSSANMPSTSTTKYQYATDSQKRQTRTEIIVDKQEGKITQLAQETTERIEQVQEQANINTDEIARLGATETVEGTYLTVDASNNPAKLYVYGNTEQETSIQGKNKLDLGQDSYSRLGVNINLKGSKLSVNGTVTTSGNFFNTDEIVVDYIHLGKFTAGTYRFSKFISSGNYTIDSNAGAGTFACYITKSDKTSLANIGGSASSGSGITITLTEDTDLYIQIWCNVGAVFENYVLDFQLEEGNTTTELENFVPNMPSPDYPSDIRNIGDNTQLFDKSTITKGYRLSTTGQANVSAEINYTSDFIPVAGNETYIRTNTVDAYTRWCFYDSSKAFISKDDTNQIITTPSNARYIRFSEYISRIDTMKLEKGTKLTNYSEYDCGSVGVKIQNKNIFNLEKWFKGLNTNYCTKTLLENGIKLSFTAGVDAFVGHVLNPGTIINKQFRDQLIRVKPSTKYTITLSSAPKCYIGRWDENYSSIGYSQIPATLNKTTYTFTTQANQQYISVRVGISSEQYTTYSFTDIQIEEGDTATDYIEGKTQTVIFPLAEGQLLHKGDYLAKDGIHQVMGTRLLIGNEKIRLMVSTQDNSSIFAVLENWNKDVSDRGNILCTHLKNEPINWRNRDECIFGGGPNEGDIVYFKVLQSRLSELTHDACVNLVKEQYANGTPIQVEYKLANETIIPYTPEQQKVLDSIETFKGINHIYCIDEITPERIILTYYPNTPYNDTLVNKDTFDKVTTDMNAEFNIRANEVETSVREQTTATILTLLNNNYLNAEQVNALVEGNAEDIATVKEQLTQTVTSSQMQIEITKAIEGGVSYLKNTLFTIDENGMWIATSQDAFNALYNNKGMYLYSYEEMIAKFDVDGTTIQGNLTLEGEFITPNLRMMNVDVSGVPHTHIHWIGG